MPIKSKKTSSSLFVHYEAKGEHPPFLIDLPSAQFEGPYTLYKKYPMKQTPPR
jgi:hypothetical protein